ncbi:hypothetical protein HANVADRAFT_51603, partial [Hanseniaspora valbyensis NRRL Y-1626]
MNNFYQLKTDKKVQKKATHACIRCQQKKCKCIPTETLINGEKTCEGCMKRNLHCLFKEQHKRGPINPQTSSFNNISENENTDKLNGKKIAVKKIIKPKTQIKNDLSDIKKLNNVNKLLGNGNDIDVQNKLEINKFPTSINNNNNKNSIGSNGSSEFSAAIANTAGQGRWIYKSNTLPISLLNLPLDSDSDNEDNEVTDLHKPNNNNNNKPLLISPETLTNTEHTTNTDITNSNNNNGRINGYEDRDRSSEALFEYLLYGYNTVPPPPAATTAIPLNNNYPNGKMVPEKEILFKECLKIIAKLKRTSPVTIQNDISTLEMLLRQLL